METVPQQSATSAALPEVPQTSAAQLDNDPAVKSAVTFLNDPRVKSTPLDRRLTFLRNKGMTPEQIRHACAKAGIQVSEEQILKLPKQTQPGIAPATASPAPSKAVRNPYQGAAPVQTQMLYPHSPPPEVEPTPAKSYDWRDVVIGTGAAVLAGVGAFKLFQRYSPYELRRKSDPKPVRGRPPRPGAQRRLPRSSGSDTETTDRTPPLPSAPAEAPKPAQNDETVKRLETELSEAKEALASERKRAADLAVGSAKVKGEKQQLVRANDRLTEEVEELKAKIEELEKALEEKNNASPKSPKSPAAPWPAADDITRSGTPQEGSHRGSHPSSPRSRPATPPALTSEPRSTSPLKADTDESAAAQKLTDVSGIAVIDPVSATAPSQQGDADES